jgi:hypothetical protein
MQGVDEFPTHSICASKRKQTTIARTENIHAFEDRKTQETAGSEKQAEKKRDKTPLLMKEGSSLCEAHRTISFIQTQDQLAVMRRFVGAASGPFAVSYS